MSSSPYGLPSTLTGTPGPRGWLANLRAHPDAVLHLSDPARDVKVVAHEV